MPARAERGAGLVGTIGGLAVFLVLLSFAAQLLFNLYATSALTAAAHDAAHLVAREGGDRRPETLARAEAHARSILGRYGSRTSFEWWLDDDLVRLTVRARHPHLALHVVTGAFGLNEVERTVVVRSERPR